jgi:hypothetical protein
MLASEQSEGVTNFIFCWAAWYFLVSIIFTFRWHVYHPQIKHKHGYIYQMQRIHFTNTYLLLIDCLLSVCMWVRIQFRQGVLDTTLCDKVCQWRATGRLPAICNFSDDVVGYFLYILYHNKQIKPF